MKIFFTGSITGGRAQQPAYEKIVNFLKTKGEVFGAQVAEKEISHYGETELSMEEVHDREIERVQNADLVVAEITTPSFGVGYLLHAASSMNKKIVCLYRGNHEYKLSGILRGDKNLQIEMYEYDDEIENILNKYL
jgi:hypothetical protein